MWIIGCDFHPRYQQIAALDQTTGEIAERRLSHEENEAAAFYEVGAAWSAGRNGSDVCRALVRAVTGPLRAPVVVGDSAQFVLWPCANRRPTCAMPGTCLQLLVTEQFPRIWIPAPAERDTRQLLLHRHKLVQWRTQVQNQLHALARNEGVRLAPLLDAEGRQQLESLSLDHLGVPAPAGFVADAG